MIYDDMFEPEIDDLPPETGQTEPESGPKEPEPDQNTPKTDQNEPETGVTEPSSPGLLPDTGDVDTDIEDGFTEPYPEADPDFTPEPPAMRRRFDRHKPFNDIQAAYWMKFIERNPYRFDALLYRAEPIEAEELPDDYEQPEFNNVDIRQTEPVYCDPELVAVLDSPDESEVFASMDLGGENAVDSGTFLILQIAAEDVPVGSVLEWQEETSNGEPRRVWWYVLRAGNYGTTKAGTLYYCIPCRTFKGVVSNA